MYEYGDIKVQDFFKDHLDEEGKAYFKRRMSFEAPGAQEMFYFRLASGKNVAPTAGGWKIDQLEIRLPENLKPQVRDGDPKELIVPLTIPEGKTTIELEYRW